MIPLPLDRSATLAAHEAHPGSRVELVCAACTWSRTYRPERIIEGLSRKQLGGRHTTVASVALLVRWPCPGCRRMRWATRLSAPAPDQATERPRSISRMAEKSLPPPPRRSNRA
ncbi:hypothetical protein [Phenylobacterium sp.]|uniref:hypothetical protein n=1 Tax=Phenylobacterium sp. TaxID=1871053 RepID=UPI002C2B69C3|nr:hypothetical protein [Phenylobacterium sp.]HVI30864.1 hypothetical protein [Phenylobacterium sp.]